MTSRANSLDQFYISFANKRLQNFIQKNIFGESHSGDNRSLSLHRITNTSTSMGHPVTSTLHVYTRSALLPPAVCVLLVVFNRNPNPLLPLRAAF